MRKLTVIWSDGEQRIYFIPKDTEISNLIHGLFPSVYTNEAGTQKTFLNLNHIRQMFIEND